MRPALPLLRAAAGGALLLALAGCAGRGGLPRHPAPGTLPPGSPLRSATLARGDAWLRHYLMAGDFDAAVAMLAPGSRSAPGDELVRHLQLGVVLHQAGRWAESNAAFEWAEREAEDRVTRSATRAVGSMLLNDGVLEYVPSPSERAMIPYHRTLNYLALGSRDEAVVEARKAGALLAAVDKPGCGDAFLPYLGGLVFGAAGERNDALVALRRSQRAWDACEGGVAAPGALGEDLFRAASLLGVRDVADSARSRYRIAEPAPAAGTGDLVVVVEHGWVAHRAAEDLRVPVFPDEVDGLDDDDRESLAAASGRITARLLGSASGSGPWGRPYGRTDVSVADALAGAHVLKVAWPAYRLEASRPAALRVLVDDTVADAALVQDVSSGVERDFAGRRAMVLARAVGRGVLKYVVAREVEKKTEKEGGEVAGFFAGRLLNLAGNVLEQADTRSWSLLPDRISLARLALPAGEHRVRIEVSRGGWDGAVDTLDLGIVVVREGERVFRSRRVWGDEQGDPFLEERRWEGPVLAAAYPDPVVRPGWEGDAVVASAPPPPPPVRADAPVASGPREEGEPRLDVPAQRPRVVDAGPERKRPESVKAERVSSAPREAPRPSVRTRPEP